MKFLQSKSTLKRPKIFYLLKKNSHLQIGAILINHKAINHFLQNYGNFSNRIVIYKNNISTFQITNVEKPNF